MIKDIQSQIIQLKKDTDTSILAHSYQGEEILEVADFVGDSFMLSQQAASAPNQNLLMCGVHFMAQTAKLLSPDKNVYLANVDAGCPMAEQLSGEELLRLKKQYPDHAVVCYINTTAEVKKYSDVCVTSASAVKIVREMPEQKILFVPDINLGSYVKSQVPEKDIVFYEGGCPFHAAVTADDAARAKQSHPNALLLVHPECTKQVCEMADMIGSTSAIMDYAINSPDKEFIIGTEISIVEHLSFACPEKRFYALSKSLICPEMKITSLADVYNAVKAIADGDGTAHEITMSAKDIEQARVCIDRMLELG